MSLSPSGYNLLYFIVENKYKLQKTMVLNLLQNCIYIICTAGWESNPHGDIKENVCFPVWHTDVWLCVVQSTTVLLGRHEHWMSLPCVTGGLWRDIYQYFRSYHLPDGSHNVCFCKSEIFSFVIIVYTCNLFYLYNMHASLCSVYIIPSFWQITRS